MAEKKSGIGTLEILVAIFTVVFIFSLIGVINLKPVAESTTEAFVEAAVPVAEETSGTTSSEAEEIVVIEETATKRPSLVSGTTLSPALSEFEVVP